MNQFEWTLRNSARFQVSQAICFRAATYRQTVPEQMKLQKNHKHYNTGMNEQLPTIYRKTTYVNELKTTFGNYMLVPRESIAIALQRSCSLLAGCRSFGGKNRTEVRGLEERGG